MNKKQLDQISKDECRLEMTPLIDTTFLLLIFFMCTIKFKTLEGKLAAYLPKDVGVNTTEAEPIEKVEIMVRVLNEGTKYSPRGPAGGLYDPAKHKRYTYGADRKIEYRVGPKTTEDIAELQRYLKTTHTSQPERPATIDARKGTIYADIARVLDATLIAGFKEVTFVGSYE
jgi:biopolymer transport protein ExbD